MDTVPKLLELRPDRSLLNPNFEGYKLSLETMSKLRLPLSQRPDRVAPNEEQYSFMHAHLFSMHNHLVQDPWTPNSVYYIDANWVVQSIKYNTNTGTFEPIRAVLNCTKTERQLGDYNYSLHFVSEKYALLSDGRGTLQILDTGDRVVNHEWKNIHSGRPLNDVPTTGFTVQDARFDIVGGQRHINCILLHVERTEDGFMCVLDWVLLSLHQSENTWLQRKVKQLTGKSLPTYCALDAKGTGLILSGDVPFRSPKSTSETNTAQSNDGKDISQSDVSFRWTQTDDEVLITFDIEKTSEKQDFKIVSDTQRLHVLCKQSDLLDAELYSKVDAGLTTWQLENETLSITLMKSDESVSWPSLLSGLSIAATDMPIVEQRDPGSNANLSAEMEDCDFGDSLGDFYLERIDSLTDTVTHRVSLGSMQSLFQVQLRQGQPPALAVRHDVDVCVYQPTTAPTTDDLNEGWILSHKGTLNAFGYVQASKQQKKYMKCSPDMSYAIICEAHRHVFMYKSVYGTATHLKNRKGGKVSIGQQKLFTMDDGGSDEIVGILVENDVTILLTEKEIICLQINA